MASKNLTQSELINRYILALTNRNFIAINNLKKEIARRGLDENKNFQTKLSRRINKAKKDAINNYKAEVRNRNDQARAGRKQSYEQYDTPIVNRHPAAEAAIAKAKAKMAESKAEAAQVRAEARAEAEAANAQAAEAEAQAAADKQANKERIRKAQKQRYKQADIDYAPTEENPIPRGQPYTPEKQFANYDKKITPKKRIGSMKSVAPILGMAGVGYGIGNYMRNSADESLNTLSVAPGVGSLATGSFGAGLYGRKKLLDMYDKYGTKDMGVKQALGNLGRDITGATRDWYTRRGVESRNWFPWLRDQEKYDADIAKLEERKQKRFGRMSDQRVEDYNKLVDEMAGKTAEKPVIEEPAFREAMRRQIDADIANAEAVRQKLYDDAEAELITEKTEEDFGYKPKKGLQPDDVIVVDPKGKAVIQDNVSEIAPQINRRDLFVADIKGRERELRELRNLRTEIDNMTQADYDARIAAKNQNDPLRRYLDANEGIFGAENKVKGERLGEAVQDTAEDLLNKGKAAGEDIIDKGKDFYQKGKEAVGLSENIDTPKKPGFIKKGLSYAASPITAPIKGINAISKAATPIMAPALGQVLGEAMRGIYDTPEGERLQKTIDVGSALPGQIYDELSQGIENVQNIYDSPEGGFVPAAAYTLDKSAWQPLEYTGKSAYNAVLTGADKIGELFGMDANTWRPEYLNLQAAGFHKGAPQKYRFNEQTGKTEEIPEGIFNNNWARDYDIGSMHDALATTREKVAQANKDYFASRNKPVPPGVIDEINGQKQPKSQTAVEAAISGAGGGQGQQQAPLVPGQQYDGTTFKNMYGNTPVYQTADYIDGKKVTSFSDTPAGARYGAGQISVDQMGADPGYQARAEQVNQMRAAQAEAQRQQEMELLKLKYGKGDNSVDWGKDYMGIAGQEDREIRSRMLQQKQASANTPEQSMEAVRQSRVELANYAPDTGFFGSLVGRGGINPLEYLFSGYNPAAAHSALQQGQGTYNPQTQQFTVYDTQGKPDYDFKVDDYRLAKDNYAQSFGNK